MSQEHNKSCPMCTLTTRIFGSKFAGCGDVSNKPAHEAVDLLVKRMDELNEEAKAARASGKISPEEYQEFLKLIADSFPYAASMVPAMALLAGARSDPVSMMQMVQANMKRAAEVVLQSSGLGSLLGAIQGLINKSESPESDEDEESEPASLSQLN